MELAAKDRKSEQDAEINLHSELTEEELEALKEQDSECHTTLMKLRGEPPVASSLHFRCRCLGRCLQREEGCCRDHLCASHRCYPQPGGSSAAAS